MNEATLQKIAALAFAMSFLFPPFLVGLPNITEPVNCGYGFILLEQTFQDSSRLRCRVDVALLLVEWAFIAICLMALNRRHLATAIHKLLDAGQKNRDAQILLTNKQIDAQAEVAHIIASAIVQHAEEQRKQQHLF
jgi:hypothetical protein